MRWCRSSLAACFAYCGTTYCSPSLPMFAFVLDAGNVAPLLLWAAERGGRACVCCGAAELGGGGTRGDAERRELIKCGEDNASARPGFLSIWTEFKLGWL